MFADDENLLNNFIKSRNLSLRTSHGYKDALNKYTLFNDESFVYLLNEADFEEEQCIRWKNRKLKERLINFRLYLIDNFMYSTAKTHFQRILTLYKHYEIEIHDLPQISTKSINNSYVISFEDLPTKEIIKQSIEIAIPVMSALILFMSSSGCSRSESLNLTINDFVNSTFEYHGSNNINEALFILNSLDGIIPTFKLRRQKTNKFYFTFCSPEATKAIVNYLLTRKDLKKEDKLFKINLDYLNTNFKIINENLGLKKIGKYRRLRCHMLRKFHASTLYNSKKGLSLEEIDSLQGRSKDKTHSSYFMENPNILKEKYISCLDDLRIF